MAVSPAQLFPSLGSSLAAALHRDSTQGLDPTHLNALVRWTHSSRRLQVEGPQHQTYFSGVTADCRTEYHTSAQVQWRATHADAATAHGRHDAIARATRQHVTDAAHGILSQRLQQHRLNPDTTTTTDAALLDRQHIVGTSLRFSVNGTSYHGTVVAVGACQHESNSKLTSRLAYIDVHASPCTSHIHMADCIYTMSYDDTVYSQRHRPGRELPDAEPLLARGRSSTSSFSSTISAAHSSESSDSDGNEAQPPVQSLMTAARKPGGCDPNSTFPRQQRRRKKTFKRHTQLTHLPRIQSHSSCTTSAPPHNGAETTSAANRTTKSI